MPVQGSNCAYGWLPGKPGLWPQCPKHKYIEAFFIQAHGVILSGKEDRKIPWAHLRRSDAGGGFYSYPICSSTCPIEPANREPSVTVNGPSTAVVGSGFLLDISANNPDGDALSYHWAILSKPESSNISITDTSVSDLFFTADTVGRYLFSLVADDGELAADTIYQVVDVESVSLAGFNLSTIQEASFSTRAAGVTVGNVDADTTPDVVVGLCNGSIRAYLNDGSGNLTGQTSANAFAFCNSVPVIGEYNGDTHSDVASYNVIVQGDGSGSYSSMTTLAFSATNITGGDFNKDGKRDIAAIKALPNAMVKIMHGDGMGGFTEGYSASSPTEIVPLGVGDFNADGIDDLVYFSELFDVNGNSELTVLMGDSGGNYNSSTTLIVPGRGALGVGDINGDNDIDIVMSFKMGTQPNLPPSVITNVGIGFATILGNGDGSFDTLNRFDAANLSMSNIAIYDFDEDGHQDFVYRGDTYSVNVLTGGGLGGIDDVAILPVSNDFGFGFAVGEIDGDNRPDILIAGNLGSSNGEHRIAFGASNHVP